MARGRVELETTSSTRIDEWDSDPWGDESAAAGQSFEPTGRDQGFGDEYIAGEFPDASYVGFGDEPEDTIASVQAYPMPTREYWYPRAETDDLGSTNYEGHDYLDTDARSADSYLAAADPGFDSDAFLRIPQKPTLTPAGKRRRTFVIAGVIGVLVLGAVSVAALRGGSGDLEPSTTAVGTTAAVKTTESPTPSTVASAPASGDTTSGPGVILGFDDAYYKQRNGAAAAGYLVASQNTPATAQAIQADIDRLDPLTTHNIMITSTGTENVYNVRLTITAPDGVSHEYHQQYTMVSAGGRFYIANKLNCDSVCPTP